MQNKGTFIKVKTFCKEMFVDFSIACKRNPGFFAETNRNGRVVEEEEEGTSKEVEEEGTSKVEEGASKVEEDTSKEVEEEGTSNTIRITKATSNSSREAIIEVVTKAIATTPEEILDTTIEEEATTEG